ncbi:hypothetical protein [Calothrix sp. NIES-3974]|uniref:hypothetical protein n=1 Tax=Calothrix sp. NIES-3974 TaxID=2005462 RepID=UPI0012FDC275|nr:hypothetical protein [Calothrix sp. NIES-3974]
MSDTKIIPKTKLMVLFPIYSERANTVIEPHLAVCKLAELHKWFALKNYFALFVFTGLPVYLPEYLTCDTC